MQLSKEEALDDLLTEAKATEMLNVPSVRDALHIYLEDEVREKIERSKKYNHCFFLGFSVNTDVSVADMEADDNVQIPVEEVKAALHRRVEDLFRPKQPLGGKVYYEIWEAIGFPDDTYENHDD